MPFVDPFAYLKMIVNVGILYSCFGSSKKSPDNVVPPQQSTSPIIQCSNAQGCTIKLLYANNQTATLPASYWHRELMSSYLTLPNGLRAAGCIGLATIVYCTVDYMRSLSCVRSDEVWGAFEENTELVELASSNHEGAVLKRLLAMIIIAYPDILLIDEKIHAFLVDTRKEIEAYQQVISYRHKFQKFKISSWMPGSDEDLLKAATRLKRCQFLKKMVSSYLAEKYATQF